MQHFAKKTIIFPYFKALSCTSHYEKSGSVSLYKKRYNVE
jgi:hypothetical protein